MSLHLPHHIPHPHVDRDLLGLLRALAAVAGLFMVVVAIWWIATYGGGPIPS